MIVYLVPFGTCCTAAYRTHRQKFWRHHPQLPKGASSRRVIYCLMNQRRLFDERASTHRVLSHRSLLGHWLGRFHSTVTSDASKLYLSFALSATDHDSRHHFAALNSFTSSSVTSETADILLSIKLSRFLRIDHHISLRSPSNSSAMIFFFRPRNTSL